MFSLKVYAKSDDDISPALREAKLNQYSR